MEALLIKLIVALVVGLGGVVVDNASDRAVSTAIGYDNNTTHYECKPMKINDSSI